MFYFIISFLQCNENFSLFASYLYFCIMEKTFGTTSQRFKIWTAKLLTSKIQRHEFVNKRSPVTRRRKYCILENTNAKVTTQCKSKQFRNAVGQFGADALEPGTVSATSTLASGGDDRRGSLGTASSKYDGLDSSTQIDVTVNGGRLEYVMRLISDVWSNL